MHPLICFKNAEKCIIWHNLLAIKYFNKLMFKIYSTRKVVGDIMGKSSVTLMSKILVNYLHFITIFGQNITNICDCILEN